MPRRFGLSRVETATWLSHRFGWPIEHTTLRNWEQNRRIPPKHVRAYLKVIDKQPEAVRAALGR